MQSQSSYFAQLRGAMGADLRALAQGFAPQNLPGVIWWTFVLACLAAITFGTSATPAFVLIGAVIIRYILTRRLF